MTTIVTVQPHGHYAEAVIVENGLQGVQRLDPHGTTNLSVYDGKSVLVREVAGWAPKAGEEVVEPELTYGGQAVGLTFNPSGDQAVSRCKGGFANLIDQMNNLRNTNCTPEVKRLASVAITEAQTAQMWAVKALTWRG
jgi:hypothetical protein